MADNRQSGQPLRSRPGAADYSERRRSHVARGQTSRRYDDALTMTASAIPPLPSHWSGLLSDEQWLVGTHAVGEQRLNDLHEALTEVSAEFRDAFIVNLHHAAAAYPAGKAILIAIMRATDEAADRAEDVRCASAEVGA